MSAPSAQLQPEVVIRRPREISRLGILALGVIVIPFALSAVLNSYGALTEESAVRMAFATVAGQTIAILSALVVVALTIARHRGVSQVAIAVAIACAVTFAAIGFMSSAGDLLLTRLDIVTEVNLLN